jgi:alpha-amylase
MPDGPAREAAADHLFRGQSNDCYWHGLFGGIYIAHMRAATLSHLIAAEDAADTVLDRQSRSVLRDLDLDGRDEVLLSTEGQVVGIELDEGGGIGSWDLRAARHALTSVLRRRPEAYHETLRAHERAAAEPAKAAKDGAGGAPASIHEIVLVKEANLSDKLVYDDYERRSGLVRFLARDATAATWLAGGRDELGDFVDSPFRCERLGEGEALLARAGIVTVDGSTFPVAVETTIRVGGGRLDPTLDLELSVTNGSDRPLECRIGSEWAITMLGGGGNPQAWWEVDGERFSHDGSGEAESVEAVAQGNDWLGVELRSEASPAADAWRAPIETVSNSEAGFERVYQGSALLLSWPVSIAPGARWSAAIRHRVTTAHDRAAEEHTAGTTASAAAR